MTPLQRTRLEKAASDCGFERSPEFVDGSLIMRSAQFPESVSVRVVDSGGLALSASHPLLLPPDAMNGVAALSGFGALYTVLQKAAATARTLPNRVAEKFKQATAQMPKATEAERWVVQRVGQDLFRAALLDYWQGKCCATGLDVVPLLRASHIKPWGQCETDEERLDVFNGLLLAPHLDALFDGGWISFTDEGAGLISPRLPGAARDVLGVDGQLGIPGLRPRHFRYLEFHRIHVFRGVA